MSATATVTRLPTASAVIPRARGTFPTPAMTTMPPTMSEPMYVV